MTINVTVVGTNQQPVIEKNQVATIGDLKLSLPSAAGVPSYFYYWLMVTSLNPGIFPNYSYDQDAIAKANTLADAMEQEWVSNPLSGHNVAIG